MLPIMQVSSHIIQFLLEVLETTFLPGTKEEIEENDHELVRAISSVG